jgi:hypothetical protein
LFELYSKQTVTRQEAEEIRSLISGLKVAVSQLKVAGPERHDGPIPKLSFLVPAQIAHELVFNKAQESGLSRVAAHTGATAAELKASGNDTQSDVVQMFRSGVERGLLTSRDLDEAIDELKTAGLWPWKGLD